MEVHGIAITDDQIDAALRKTARLRTNNLANRLEDQGVPWLAPDGFQVAQEAANRILQRERKAGRIRHLGGGTWARILPPAPQEGGE